MINKSLEEVFPPLEVEYLVEQHGKAIVSRKAYRYHARTAFKGNAVYLRTTLVPVFGESGEYSHFIRLSEVKERRT